MDAERALTEWLQTHNSFGTLSTGNVLCDFCALEENFKGLQAIAARS